MPDPLSWNTGLGMNVAVLPYWWATFFTTYLNSISLSAMRVSSSKRTSISACPAVPTSWCCSSTSMPTCSSASIISVRRSWKWSAGGRGK